MGTSDATPHSQHPVQARDLDLTALKALAHPLRIGIWNSLSMFGPATSSTLAVRLGESSGLMSYHLRTLAQHGFIEEIPDRGTARERWWQSVPGRTTIDTNQLAQSPAGKAALDIYLTEMTYSSAASLRDFQNRALHEEPQEWLDAATVSIANASMTVEELGAFVQDMEALVRSWIDRVRGKERSQDEVVRPVQVQLNAFPLADPNPPEDVS